MTTRGCALWPSLTQRSSCATPRELREHGITLASISVGGTPTARHAAAIEGVTEVRPGIYVLSDRHQVTLGWGRHRRLRFEGDDDRRQPAYGESRRD
jgi:D-serine deaminase-like pyridoxal phosphate-dependent protein